jgi:hypothetical protein
VDDVTTYSSKGKVPGRGSAAWTFPYPEVGGSAPRLRHDPDAQIDARARQILQEAHAYDDGATGIPSQAEYDAAWEQARKELGRPAISASVAREFGNGIDRIGAQGAALHERAVTAIAASRLPLDESTYAAAIEAVEAVAADRGERVAELDPLELRLLSAEVIDRIAMDGRELDDFADADEYIDALRVASQKSGLTLNDYDRRG